MARTSVRTTTFRRSRKSQAASRAISRARAVLRARDARAVSGILRTGGFRGVWNGRGAAELKYIEPVTLTTNIPSAGQINLFNGVASGTDFNQRIGRKITMKSLYLRFTLNPIATASAPVGDIVRVMMIYDTQANGALPSVTDVLVTANWQAAMNLNNRDRFKVLYDKFINMPANTYTAGALTAGSPTQKYLSKFKQCSLEVVYSGTAATIGSIATGAVYTLVISSANNVSNINLDIRTRFIDN